MGCRAVAEVPPQDRARSWSLSTRPHRGDGRTFAVPAPTCARAVPRFRSRRGKSEGRSDEHPSGAWRASALASLFHRGDSDAFL